MERSMNGEREVNKKLGGENKNEHEKRREK